MKLAKGKWVGIIRQVVVTATDFPLEKKRNMSTNHERYSEFVQSMIWRLI